MITKLAEYLAHLPYTIGHQLGDQHVVVGAFDSDLRTIAHAAIDWNDGNGSDDQTAEKITAYLGRVLKPHPVARLIVTAYGPEGPARSQALADAVKDALGLRTEQIHVQEDFGRLRQSATGTWGPAVRLTGVVPRAALGGRPVPAASREELLESVAPLSVPLFGDIAADRAAALSSSSPLLRAEVAQHAIDTLATGPVDDLQQMSVLSHLITTDIRMRDCALAHAIGASDELMGPRTSALVRTFRAAPPDERPELASTAAAAAFLAVWPPPIVHGLLRYANESSGLTTLVTRAIEAGVDPRPMRPGIARASQDQLTRLEDDWTAQRPAPRLASGRTVSSPAPSVPSTGYPRREHHDPGAGTPEL
ncbi:hypothetical protein GCM10010413_36530 [Promicromonospora sukumoe]|uniref:DUF4192 family protein n=1 Tax=Promicromonospora sukumoe TaxID=88382 RepID=A0A7W3J795_9MICO|nr:hypothetical protein [Promicromonospora sukumoe]MBA8807595.1 hypothetical protein [Promicromonospora sukumoe]